MHQTDPKDSVTLSVEKIIDLIRTVRNDLIKDFLNDQVLNKYYEAKFNKSLSPVKREFFKRDLHELLIQPVDLVHYSKLINHIKDTGTIALEEKNAGFFYAEIDRVIVKY